MGCARSSANRSVVPAIDIIDTAVPVVTTSAPERDCSSGSVFYGGDANEAEDNDDDRVPQSAVSMVSCASQPAQRMSDVVYINARTHTDAFALGTHTLAFMGQTSFAENSDSCANPHVEPEFEQKALCFSGDAIGDVAEMRNALAKLGVGVSCRKGAKKHSPNQDNIFFCHGEAMTAWGVADGHGDDGHWVSHWSVMYIIAQLLRDVISSDHLPEEAAMQRFFNVAEETLTIAARAQGFDIGSSGCTLTLCILHRASRELVTGWVGDSRCVQSKTGDANPEMITTDHKPGDVSERKRIVSLGGVVKEKRVTLPSNSGGVIDALAVSRALGDTRLKKYGVSHNPSFQRRSFSKEHAGQHCILCCSDGVWEFLGNDAAIKGVLEAGQENVATAVEDLATLARSRWLEELGESAEVDDISVIAVWI